MEEIKLNDDSVMKKLKKNYTNGYSNQSTTSKSSHLIPLLISFLYSSIMTFLNSFIVVVIHDRTPDRDKHPPLPDVLLDNIPYRPWSFKASEVTVIFFVVVFAMLLTFHKHRLVVLRRFFIIYGTVIFLRCPCLYVTSLPVSSHHLLCDPQMDDNVWSKLKRAWGVYSKFGMSTRGVNTCGDYMFSGHAVALTLANLFINQYTPLRLLHLLSWGTCLAGMFLIIAGHAHYTFDIVVAFIISALYHYYYHVIVNNICYDSEDGVRNLQNSRVSLNEQRYRDIIINEKPLHKNGTSRSNFLYKDKCKTREHKTTNGFLYPPLNLHSKSEDDHPSIHDKYLHSTALNNTIVNYHKNDVEENSLTFHFEHDSRPRSLLQRLCFSTNKTTVLIPFFFFEKEISGTALPHTYESPLKALGRCLKSVNRKSCYK